MASTHVYREFMKTCLERKNLKGQPAEVIREALKECAEAWTQAKEERVVQEIDELELARKYISRF